MLLGSMRYSVQRPMRDNKKAAEAAFFYRSSVLRNLLRHNNALSTFGAHPTCLPQ